MKNVKLFSMALAALMLGACSSDEVALGGGQEGTVTGGEKGYVNVAINLPTQPTSRANDVYDDGETYEYNVKDARLLLFTGTSEANAVYQGIYTIGTGFAAETPDDDNITSQLKNTVEIVKPQITGSQKIYAFVLLNAVADGVLTTTGTDQAIGNVKLVANTTKFTDIAYASTALDVAKIADTQNSGSFLMSNAPLFTAQGGVTAPATGAVTVLSEIDPNNVYTTSTEAAANPAASIYVERAVAKVTVNDNTTTPAAGELNAVVMGWTLDITNKNSYLVRNTSTADWWQYIAATTTDYRFVGSVPVAAGLYRTYWGTDPNYNGTDVTAYTDAAGNVLATYDGFNKISGTAPTGNDLTDAGEDAYCLENTFNVDNQKKDQTTRVIVAARLLVGGADDNGDFFVLNNAKGTIYKQATIKNIIINAYLAEVDGILHGTTGLDLAAGETFGAEDIVVEFISDGPTENTDIAVLGGGIVKVADIHVKSESADKFVNDQIPSELSSNNDAVTAEINEHNKISYYKGGIAYYPIRVRHFDDNQTPWSEVGKEESYPEPNAENNWLGRYGVLRNNWYEINVTGIKTIGSAEVEPEYGDDDPVEEWVSYEINVLSWAKRTQNVDL